MEIDRVIVSVGDGKKHVFEVDLEEIQDIEKVINHLYIIVIRKEKRIFIVYWGIDEGEKD